MSNFTSKVNSRFVSQSEIDSTTTAGPDADYDPRSLYERLQAHKEAKNSKYEEMFKLSNQFRGIDEGESEFLAQVAGERKREREERERREREELELFRRAKAGVSVKLEKRLETVVQKGVEKDQAVKKDESTTVQSGVAKKKRKTNSGALLGVVKKKPASGAAKSASETAAKSASTASSATAASPSSTDASATATKPPSTASSEPAPPAKANPPQNDAKDT